MAVVNRYIIGLFLFCLAAASCTRLQIDHSIRPDGDDWPMFGKSPSRTSSSKVRLKPPLTKLWEHDITGGIGNGSPVIVDSVVFVGNQRGELYGLQMRTGKRHGWIDLGEAIEGSPVVAGAIAYTAVSNSLESVVAYNLNSASVEWKAVCGDIVSSPLLVDGSLFVGNTAGSLFCINTLGGTITWRYDLAENILYKGIRSSPSFGNGEVFFGADDGSVYALNATTGKLLWKHETGGAIFASVAVAGEEVIACNVNGRVVALSSETGTPRWEVRTNGSIYAGPAVSDSIVVVGTASGMLIAVSLMNGNVLWQTDVGGPVNATPVIGGEHIYVGTQRRMLLAVSLDTGDIAWSSELPGRVKTAAAIRQNKLVIATDTRLVIAWEGAGQ